MSRDIDRQIAEALGYAVLTGTTEYDELAMDWEVWVTDPARASEPARSRQDATINPIHYSTDLTAAWTLIDRCYSGGVERLSGGAAYEAFVVIDRDGANADGYASSDTPAEAICMAFLAAME